MNVDDLENTIYLWQDFGTNAEYDEILVWQDVRLYEGAIVQVSDNVELEFESENAQIEDLKIKENPLGAEKAFSMEEGETLIAGEDFEAGVYDVAISTAGGWGLLYINTTTTDPYAEDGYFQNQIWLNDYESGNCYHNLYIPEGSEIYIEGEDAALFTPSEEIADIDYTDYYELNDYESGNCYHNLYIPEGSEIYIEGEDAALFTPSEEIADIDYTDYYEKYY